MRKKEVQNKMKKAQKEVIKTKKIIPLFIVLILIGSLFGTFGVSAVEYTTLNDMESMKIDATFKDLKMESTLTYIINVDKEKPADFLDIAKTRGLDVIADKIRVVIELTDGDPLAISSLEKYDITIETTYKNRNLVQALVPVSKIKSISEEPLVQYVRTPLKAIANVGEVMSEGAYTIHADDLHNQSIKGEGVKVAIIDLGFEGYQDIPAEIPPENIIEAKSFCGDIEAGEKHGTACTEIVVDVAPNASLYLLNFDTEVEFANAVDYAIEQDVDIISHSVGWFYGPFDGTGYICDIANDAHDSGILFVNSIGNSAQRHWEGAYDEEAISVDSDSDIWYVHKFAPEPDDVTNSFYAHAGEQITVTLSWDDWPWSDQDFDLYLVNDDTMTIVWGSENPQTGTQSPFEAFTYEVPISGEYGILIREYRATKIVNFEVYTFYHNLEYKIEGSSLTIPADAEGVMAVGATYWEDDRLESFSSQGPTNDGRIKPDVTAPDGVSTITYGIISFFGTSASAPHVAGAAALLLSDNHSLTADQLQSALEETAVDLGVPGKDNLFGSGRINLTITPSWDPWVYDTRPPYGVIDKSEAIDAVQDYFDDIITKEQALDVIQLYFGQ